MVINKKKIIICAVLIALVGVTFILLRKEWNTEIIGGYGYLNIIEQGENVSTNYTEYNLQSANKKGYEYRVSLKLIITEGSVDVRYYLGEELVYENKSITESITVPTYQWEGNSETLRIAIEPSDDVCGSYEFNVDDRASRVMRIINKYSN